MKKATKQDIRRAASLLRRIHALQASIYDFAHDLEERGIDRGNELASESGFELDESHIKMQTLVKYLQANNYGPQ